MSSISDVTILVTSFLRPAYLATCMAGISKNLPECSLVVADDSDIEVPKPFGAPLWKFVSLPFDSGLAAKRNAAVREIRTPYTLLGCDDFDFSPPAVRFGIMRLAYYLDTQDDIVLAGGRVDNRPYEGILEYVPGHYIKEYRLDVSRLNYGDAATCDLTVNYFLARTDVLRKFPWPDAMKIGGEHVCLFLDLKMARKKVVFVKGVNINTQSFDPEKQDPRYAEYRARARDLGHRLMMARYNIREYRGF